MWGSYKQIIRKLAIFDFEGKVQFKCGRVVTPRIHEARLGKEKPYEMSQLVESKEELNESEQVSCRELTGQLSKTGD